MVMRQDYMVMMQWLAGLAPSVPPSPDASPRSQCQTAPPHFEGTAAFAITFQAFYWKQWKPGWKHTHATDSALNLETMEPLRKRRRLATKNCEECKICSEDVFEVCHPHISTRQSLWEKERGGMSWCMICRIKHPVMEPKDRMKIVLGSSTLAHLWKTQTFAQNIRYHVDFDCIIGKLAFVLSYKGLLLKIMFHLFFFQVDKYMMFTPVSWTSIFELHNRLT